MVGDSPKKEGIIIIQKGLEIKQNSANWRYFALFHLFPIAEIPGRNITISHKRIIHIYCYCPKDNK